MTACRVCGSGLKPFMSFGRMPIANGFLAPDQTANEYFFELAPALCSSCGMFQIMDQPDPNQMFHSNYAFYSSTSRNMQVHFKEFAASASELLAGHDDPFVVEIGSNDGIMLRNIVERGYRHLGVEPSANVAEVARERGIKTLTAFFNPQLADRIAEEHGRADLVLAANVICHIPSLPDVAEGVRRLLKPDGVMIFEEPYLGDMVTKTSYDQIYDEHVFMFSALSVAESFGRHGLELVDVFPQNTHGGSMRYMLTHRGGSRKRSARVTAMIAAERAAGLDRPETFERFRQACETSRERLMGLLDDCRARGKRVVGYGATSKSTTVTNYCGIGPQHVEFISDTTPIKQGKLSPGAHIPVRSHEEFQRRYPDYALLFAWNHGAEIRQKEQPFITAGGRWIMYVPQAEIVA